MALLLALDDLVCAGKLDLEIVVAHLNHNLRAASRADANWVKDLAKRLARPFVLGKRNVRQRRLKSGDNLEQAARRARYEFFATAAKSHKATVVLTAHTMNDQAETILLNLIRGSGSDGLGGIEPRRPLTGDCILARPLLSWARRKDTEGFCRARSIQYRDDEMNFDKAFARVRVRTELLPALEQFNPKIVETFARSAEILRADSAALDLAAAELVVRANRPGDRSESVASVSAESLRSSPTALRRRALRLWLMQHRGNLRRIGHAHIVAIETLLLSTKSGRATELPGGGTVFRRNGLLHYRPRTKRN